ncbi:MAG: hypothetical protein JXN61_11635 [Sedimentisphaerales bacterium]|nr:hypothetical protein [Sedimentisphaerales bacterium]
MRKLISNSLVQLFLFLATLLSTTLVLAVDREASQKPIWLVVTRPAFAQAVKPLEQKRAKNGFQTLVSTQTIAEAIAGLDRQPAFLLLVGDCQPGEEEQPWYMPTQTRKLYRWRITQKEDFASDVLWGDFDDDLIPDIPVGRIPVRTPQQLKLVVDKILAFENRRPTPSDLGMPVWTGSSGYSAMLDSMATLLLLGIVEKHASPWVEPWIISANPMHPLCGWPPDQVKMFAGRFGKGGLFAVLMGHSSLRSFHSMNFNGASINYTDSDVKAGLAGDRPGPPMMIISCHTGRFVEQDNCLAETLLLQPGGPVAVVAATTESHPLTNYFSGVALLQQTRTNNNRLGSIWLAAQKQASEARDIIMERMLVEVEGKLEEEMNVAKLRRDQILMYALLGDPATQLNFPDELHADVKYSDGGWRWNARKPQGATRLYVSFRPPAQNLPQRTPQVDKETARKLFEQANDSFVFKPVAELSAEAPWEGAITEQGTLRLVATGPEQIHAAAFELKPDGPTTPPK